MRLSVAYFKMGNAGVFQFVVEFFVVQNLMLQAGNYGKMEKLC
jgi:hypothetical protein